MSGGEAILNKIVVCQSVSVWLVLLTFHVTFSEKNKSISKSVKYKAAQFNIQKVFSQQQRQRGSFYVMVFE